MTHIEINALEHASRSAMAWVPESNDRRLRLGAAISALFPAFAILSVAALMLFA